MVPVTPPCSLPFNALFGLRALAGTGGEVRMVERVEGEASATHPSFKKNPGWCHRRPLLVLGRGAATS